MPTYKVFDRGNPYYPLVSLSISHMYSYFTIVQLVNFAIAHATCMPTVELNFPPLGTTLFIGQGFTVNKAWE